MTDPAAIPRRGRGGGRAAAVVEAPVVASPPPPPGLADLTLIHARYWVDWRTTEGGNRWTAFYVWALERGYDVPLVLDGNPNAEAIDAVLFDLYRESKVNREVSV